MTQPVKYTRSYSFTAHSTTAPSDPPPGSSLDGEFNNLKTTTDEIIDNLALIQRDDGQLANDSVTLDQVATDVLLVLGTSWTVRGPWLTATPYAKGDVVSSAGTTYVCGTAHTSTVLATNIASGYWVTIFTSSGVTPSDGTVTTTKIADGAVTPAKLGFTALDLASTIRGQGGLAAGTANPGDYTIEGKKAAGDVFVRASRTTQAQGNAGFQWGGGTAGLDWTLKQSASLNDLQLLVTATTTFTWYAAGNADAAYTLRITGSQAPAAGAGVELSYVANVGHVLAYDRTGAAYKQLSLEGLTVLLVANGATVATVSSTGADFTGLSINGFNAGYRGAPVNTQNGNYTLAVADCGKRIVSTNVGAQTITIPTMASIAIPVDDGVMMIVNDGSTAITITPAGGVTLKFAGSALTGTRTLAAGGVATLMKTKTDEWFAMGAGIT